MAGMNIRDWKNINLKWLPSRGIPYPDDIEVYVTPMTIRERRLLDGITNAEYYRRLLDGIDIRGGSPFRKQDLLVADVQFIDLARRIFTYEQDRKLILKDYICTSCGQHNVRVEFSFTDIELEDLPEGIFGTEKKYTDNETGEELIKKIPGKAYTFSDGTTVYAAPMIISEYIDLATKYIANKRDDDDSEAYIAQFAYLIKDIEGMDGHFKDANARRAFLFDYVNSLYKPEDEDVLDDIERETTSILKPIVTTCPDCGADVEVYVQPYMRFQQ